MSHVHILKSTIVGQHFVRLFTQFSVIVGNESSFQDHWKKFNMFLYNLQSPKSSTTQSDIALYMQYSTTVWSKAMMFQRCQ